MSGQQDFLSLRDLFAISVATAIVQVDTQAAHNNPPVSTLAADIARDVYIIADALIAQRLVGSAT